MDRRPAPRPSPGGPAHAGSTRPRAASTSPRSMPISSTATWHTGVARHERDPRTTGAAAVRAERGGLRRQQRARRRPGPRDPRGLGRALSAAPRARRGHRRRPHRPRLLRVRGAGRGLRPHRADAGRRPALCRGAGRRQREPSPPATWRPCPFTRASTSSPAASPPITSPTSGAAVRQMAQALRPGGSLLLQDILGHDDRAAAAFILEVERRRDPSHVRSYRAVEWKALLRGAGLTPMEETVVSKIRPWEEWTGRMRMTAPARADLDRFVREAPAAMPRRLRLSTDRGERRVLHRSHAPRPRRPGLE